MAPSQRGKTTPASTTGSYAPYAHSAPDIDLNDGLESGADPFSDGFGGSTPAGSRTMPRTTGGSRAPSASHAVISINQAIAEWNQAFPDRPVAHNQEALMARALEVEQALEAGMPIPAPSWGEPQGPARGASAQAFVDAMRAGREAGLSETGAMAGLLRDQANAETTAWGETYPEGSPAAGVAAFKGKPVGVWFTEDASDGQPNAPLNLIKDDGSYVWVHPDADPTGQWFIDGEFADGPDVSGRTGRGSGTEIQGLSGSREDAQARAGRILEDGAEAYRSEGYGF
jgi:hypothetical protein